MYIPHHFKNENQDELLGFMRAHPFGLLVCNGNEFPAITHLPFTVEANEKVVLYSHFAAVNPQAQLLKDGDKVTVVFSGPHAYISPSLYDAAQNVPTWNYIAVHAQGTYMLCNEAETEALLRKMIAVYEPAYEQQYDNLPGEYITALKSELVAFTVVVEQLQGQYKLSQNKKANERERIAHHLTSDPNTHALAGYMANASPTEKTK